MPVMANRRIGRLDTMPNEPSPATPPDDETSDQRRLREHDEAEDRRRLAAKEYEQQRLVDKKEAEERRRGERDADRGSD